MNARGVRPIGFDRENSEMFLGDQSLRDLGAFEIKFMRPMRRFAKQNDPRLADQLEQVVVICRLPAERLRNLTNEFSVSHDRLLKYFADAGQLGGCLLR